MDAPTVAAWRQERLAALIEEKFMGNQTEAGRYLGYADGAMLRQLLKGTRPITEKTIAKWSAKAKVRGWFSQESPQPGAAPVNSDGTFARAHGVSHPTETVQLPHLSWETLMSGPLPGKFELTLTDDAMAPDFPQGTVITFSTQLGEPAGLDAVLLHDREGSVFFREYRFKKPGHWQAVALNSGYEALDSIADGLHVLAIMTKFTKVGRRSGRPGE